DPGGALDDLTAVLLGEAAADGDLHVGVGGLGGAEVAEVAVELVVGVLAHGAGVEHDEIGVGLALDGNIAGLFEQASDPLGVVDVHLASERPNLVSPRTVDVNHQTSIATGRTAPNRRGGGVRPTTPRPHSSPMRHGDR